jgi:hypothetical protein
VNLQAPSLAVALEGRRPLFFLSLDGASYRRVADFPIGADRAERLFRDSRDPDRSGAQLLAEFQGRIGFMLAPEAYPGLAARPTKTSDEPMEEMTEDNAVRSGSSVNAHGSRVELEPLDERASGTVLVAIRRPGEPQAAGHDTGAEQVSVGWFPAPEPWLSDVLPI